MHAILHSCTVLPARHARVTALQRKACVQSVRMMPGGRYETESIAQGKDDRSVGLCAACGAPQAAQTCTGCRAVRYCDRACQKRHWKSGHKGKCEKLRARAAMAREDKRKAGL